MPIEFTLYFGMRLKKAKHFDFDMYPRKFDRPLQDHFLREKIYPPRSYAARGIIHRPVILRRSGEHIPTADDINFYPVMLCGFSGLPTVRKRLLSRTALLSVAVFRSLAEVIRGLKPDPVKFVSFPQGDVQIHT